MVLDLPSSVVRQSIQGKGNGLVAAHDIDEASDVFRKVPAVAVPVTGVRNQVCAFCFISSPPSGDLILPATSSQVIPCTACRATFYCSEKCRIADAECHRDECAILTTLAANDAPSIPPTYAMLLMRVINLRRPARRNFYEAMEDMESHSDELARSARYESMALVARGVKAFTNTVLLYEQVFELLMKLSVNSASIVTPTYDTVGAMIDPTVALINHSCNPNAVIVFDKNVMILRTLRKIKTGEEVVISYIDNNRPMPERLRELAENYFFQCRCTTCALKVQPYNEKGDCVLFNCPKCNRDFRDASRSSLLELQKSTLFISESTLSRQPPTIQDNNEAKDLKEFLMRQNREGCIPVYRDPLRIACQQLITFYIESEMWNSAVKLVGVEYFLQDPVLFKPDYHPVRLGHMMRFAVCLLVLTIEPMPFTGQGASLWRALRYELILYGVLCELERLIPLAYGRGSLFEHHITRNLKPRLLLFAGDSGARKYASASLKDLGWSVEMGKMKKLVLEFWADLK